MRCYICNRETENFSRGPDGKFVSICSSCKSIIRDNSRKNYEDIDKQDFIDSNSGIASRIGYTLEFEDYTNDELKQIFKNMVVKSGFTLEKDALEEVDRLINENRNTKNFGNARFIRNV